MGEKHIAVAVVDRDTDAVEARLQEGADPNMVTGICSEPLLNIAVAQSDYAVARLLLDHGADPNDGALHVALENGIRQEMARLLMQCGADPSRRDSSGHTPLDCARKSLEYVEVLLGEKVEVQCAGCHRTFRVRKGEAAEPYLCPRCGAC